MSMDLTKGMVFGDTRPDVVRVGIDIANHLPAGAKREYVEIRIKPEEMYELGVWCGFPHDKRSYPEGALVGTLFGMSLVLESAYDHEKFYPQP